MTEAADLVRGFCAAMAERDVEVIRPFLATDVVYQNVGMPAVAGIENVLADLGGQFGMFPDSYEYRVVNLAADGDVVLTERLDMIRTPAGVRGIPVMGAFRCTPG